MRRRPQSPLAKYKNWIGMGLVLLVFVVVLLTVGKPSAPKASTSSKKSSATKTERVERGERVRRKRTATERLAAKAQRQLERARRREERRALAKEGVRRTSRSERSSSRQPSGGRVKVEGSYILRGIFVDERGERYALIGERRAKSGDVIVGRKIQEVQPDRVRIEYGGTYYEVKIGNSLF